MFQFTISKNHSLSLAGLKDACDLLGVDGLANLPPMYWMVPRANFERSDFQIKQQGQYVHEIQHFLLPRSEATESVMMKVINGLIIQKFKPLLDHKLHLSLPFVKIIQQIIAIADAIPSTNEDTDLC